MVHGFIRRLRALPSALAWDLPWTSHRSRLTLFFTICFMATLGGASQGWFFHQECGDEEGDAFIWNAVEQFAWIGGALGLAVGISLTIARHLLCRVGLAVPLGIVAVAIGVFLYSNGRPVSLMGCDGGPNAWPLTERPDRWGIFLGGPAAGVLACIGHLVRRVMTRPRLLVLVMGIGVFAAIRSHAIYWDQWCGELRDGWTGCGMGFIRFSNTRIPFLGGAVFLTMLVSFGCLLAELIDLGFARKPGSRPWIVLAVANVLLIGGLSVCFSVMPFSRASAVEELAFLPDGDFVVSAHRGGVLRLWRLRHDAVDQDPVITEVDTVRVRRGPMKHLRFSLSSTMAAIACPEGTVALWQVGPFKAMAELPAGTCSWKLLISPDGRSLLTWNEDRQLRLWNLNFNPDGVLGMTSVPVPEPDDMSKWLRARFSADSRMIVVPAAGYLEYYDRSRGRLQKSVEVLDFSLGESTVSPDGRLLAVRERPYEIQLKKLPSGEHVTLNPGDYSHPMAFSPDGKQLTAVTSHSVLGWETPSGKPQFCQSYPKTSTIRSLAYSPDGRAIALGMWEGGVVFLRIPRKNASASP
jgi:WD40 repeat protein